MEYYNAERKEKFLEQKKDIIVEKNLKIYKRLFKVFGQDEKRYDMDLCDFSYDILMTVLPLRLSRGWNSKATQLSLLKEYAGWCYKEKLNKHNTFDILRIKSSDIDSSLRTRKQLIKDPQHLQSILDEVLKSERDEPSVDIMYRIVCWLLYYGFTEEEIMSMKQSNVDFENNIIYNDDRTKSVVLDKNLRNLLECSISLDSVYRPAKSGAIRLDLDKSDKIIRRIAMKNNNESSDIIKIRLSLMRRNYEKNVYENVSLSTKRLRLSGIFYRLYEKEISGDKLTDDDFYFNIREGLTKQSVKIKIKRNKQEYNDWKRAFNLI